MEKKPDFVGDSSQDEGTIELENTQIPRIESEKQPIQEICNKNPTPKKEYKYHRINLVIDEERSKLLRRCCEITGYDPSRIETHDQELIWELLRWIEQALEIRAWVEATFGKVMLTGKK